MRHDLVARNHGERNAALLQLFAAVVVGRQHHFRRQSQPQLLRQDESRAHSRREAVAHEIRGVDVLPTQHDQIGKHAQYESAADAVPLHRGDHGNGTLQRQVVQRAVGERAAPVRQVQQLLLRTAAGEIIVVAGEDHHFAVRQALDLCERVHQPLSDGLGKRVLADAVLHLDLQDLRRDELQVDGFFAAHAAPSQGNWPVFT